MRNDVYSKPHTGDLGNRHHVALEGGKPRNPNIDKGFALSQKDVRDDGNTGAKAGVVIGCWYAASQAAFELS